MTRAQKRILALLGLAVVVVGLVLALLTFNLVQETAWWPLGCRNCAPTPGTPLPASGLITPSAGPEPLPSRPASTSAAPTPRSPTATSTLVLTATPTPGTAASTQSQPVLVFQSQPGENGHPTLADFWEGTAAFVVQVEDTGLPMGESETIIMGNGEYWSYLHASQRSAGTIDRCGDPVEFPGCVVIYRSYDGGYHFYREEPPVCQFECQTCPCQSERDHIDQQQYPRVAFDGQDLVLVYEYRARTMLRRSADGLNWSDPQELPYSGIWPFDIRDCPASERVHEHPYTAHVHDCLAGGPPGLWVEDDWLAVFVAVGQNPGGMGCYTGLKNQAVADFRKCAYNPLFLGVDEYGPLDVTGPQANPFFDFRTISAAELQRIGDRYYMLYEGIRGPGPGQPGDSQFGLGLARSQSSQIDGPWEKYLNNPILVDQPGNIGLGHADLVVDRGKTLLYTSLDGQVRSRLELVWK